MARAATATRITVQRDTLSSNATMTASTNATASGIRRRRWRNQRPERELPCSIIGTSVMASTVPGWYRNPDPRTGGQRGCRGDGASAVVEQAVDSRAGAADVRAERAERT